jgi:hypothetical protein
MAHASADDARLDDLFEDGDSGPAPTRVRRRLPVRGPLLTIAITAVVYTALRAFGLAPGLPLILTLAAASVLLRTATKASREQPGQRLSQLLRPARPDPADDPAHSDGVFDAVRRWDRLLDQGSTTRAGGVAGLVANLGELADERLRQHHGLTRASDPVRARALLGDGLWSLLTAPAPRPPSTADLADAIQRLERL